MTIDTIPDTLFFVCMGLATASWLALWIAPGKRLVNWWLCGVVTPSVFAVIYLYLLIDWWHQPSNQSFMDTYMHRFGSLAGVYAMFRNHGLLMVGWLDILAMDIIGGAWMARRAQRTGLAHFPLFVCLLLTYVQAPLGIGLYFLIEAARSKLTPAET